MRIGSFMLALMACLGLCLGSAGAREVVLDAMVAYVDDEIITASDLQKAMEAAGEGADAERVLAGLIDRALMLKDAAAMRIEGEGPDEIIREYINARIRLFVIVSDERIRGHYDERAWEFGDLGDYASVRAVIERRLVDTEVAARLETHLKELRGKARIRVFSPLGD